MTYDQPTDIQGYRNLLGGCQASNPQPIPILGGKYGSQVTSCGEMHRIIQPWVGPDAPLEALRRAVELAKKLDLQPAFTGLNNLGGALSACEFCYAEQAHLPYKIDQTLGQSHDRADLTNRLEAAPENGGHTGHVVIKRDGNLRTKDMTNPPDTGRLPLSHRHSQRP